MPSPFAGFHVDVPRFSSVVQLVKLLTNPKTAISKRIFISFRRYRSVDEAVELLSLIISAVGLDYSMPPDPLAVFLRIFQESPSLTMAHE
jgi:hypothetical protein